MPRPAPHPKAGCDIIIRDVAAVYEPFQPSPYPKAGCGIRRYTGSGYLDMNPVSRGKSPQSLASSSTIGHVNSLERALRDKRYAVPEDVFIGRSVNGSMTTRESFQNAVAGDVITDWGLQSWAITDNPAFGGGKVKLFAVLPKDTTAGAYVASVSSSGEHEKEFLLNRGTGFLVHRVEQHPVAYGGSETWLIGEILG